MSGKEKYEEKSSNEKSLSKTGLLGALDGIFQIYLAISVLSHLYLQQ